MFRKWREFALLVLTSVVAGVSLTSSTTVQAQTLPINVYSQRDSRWSADKMKPSNLTVGNYGCLMTCLAAAYRVSPGTLNGYLSSNRGYTSDGLLVHSVAANYDGSGGLKYSGSGRLPSSATAVGRGIQRGAVYVVQSSRPLGAGMHWVLVYNAIPGGQAYYLDPYDGTTRRVGSVESKGRVWVPYGAGARIYSFR